MRFDWRDAVTGADLCPGVILLTFSRESLTKILTLLGEQEQSVDALLTEETRGTVAILPSESPPDPEPLQAAGAEREEGEYFRLILRGRRLTEGRGLAGTWEASLTEARLIPRLSWTDGWGIVQYFPSEARTAVVALLHRTFGIRML